MSEPTSNREVPFRPPQSAPYGPQQPIDQQPPPVASYYPYPPQPTREVHKSRKSTSHGLHLFLTIITLGMWGLFVWLPITLWHKLGPRKKSVTHYR